MKVRKRVYEEILKGCRVREMNNAFKGINKVRNLKDVGEFKRAKDIAKRVIRV